MPTCSRTLCPGSAFTRNKAVEPSMLEGCGSESTVQFSGTWCRTMKTVGLSVGFCTTYSCSATTGSDSGWIRHDLSTMIDKRAASSWVCPAGAASSVAAKASGKAGSTCRALMTAMIYPNAHFTANSFGTVVIKNGLRSSLKHKSGRITAIRKLTVANCRFYVLTACQ
jgi:hypothetical protein